MAKKKAPHGSKRNKGLQLYLWGVLYTPKGFPPRLSVVTFLNRKEAVDLAKKMRFFDGVQQAKSVRLIAKMKGDI
jgi:hypothetical protein